jgi:DNA polymerase delta subunit 1
MVKFGVATIDEAMKLGKEAAEYVTQYFVQPIKLEFEKVYCPYLLMNKKRYAGLLWTKPDKFDKIDAKGIETVRRDNCGMVKETVQSCLNMLLVLCTLFHFYLKKFYSLKEKNFNLMIMPLLFVFDLFS